MVRRTLPIIAFVFGLNADVTAQGFIQKTAEVGFSAAGNANGVAVADYDLDGDLDVYFVNWNLHDPSKPSTWSRLYRNNGDGTFTDRSTAPGAPTAASVTGGPPRGMGNKLGAAWGDYDNDGDPDLFLTNVGPEILYRNDGGSFTDVTAEAGVAGPDDAVESSSPAWFDYDNDGDLDIYVSTWNGRNRMYENDGDGTFTDVTAATGLDNSGPNAGSTWSSLPFDVSGDGLTDLYLVNDYGRNRIMVNQGDGTFADETAARGLEDTGNGMGVTLGDFDNDGTFDIYLTNIYFGPQIQWNPLFRNDGTGRFTDVSKQLEVENADWAWGTVFFDCDHDGDLDLYVANGFITQPAFHNRFFQNLLIETGTASFSNISAQSGTDGSGEARSAIAFDFDGDGDLDILVANARPGKDTNEPNQPYLYENVSATQNWLQIDLEGAVSNRSGFGAVLRITSSNGTVYRHNDGVGYLGQNDAPVHVGIGPAASVDEIQVSWPSGLVESFSDIAVNQKITLIEGQGIVVDVDSEAWLEANGPRIVSTFPNPFSHRLSIEMAIPEAGRYLIDVVNVLGQVLISKAVQSPVAGNQYFALDLGELPAGAYLVRLGFDWGVMIGGAFVAKTE